MRKSNMNIVLFSVFILLVFSCGEGTRQVNRDIEIHEITRVIDSCIGWFKTKDFDLYFSAVAHDSNFIAVQPTKKVVRGFQEVLKNSEIFRRSEFQYVRHEIKDLTVNLSGSGDTAWFYCILNDINTWDGRPANWENTRWTGVLEKRDGRWVIVLNHFSFASE